MKYRRIYSVRYVLHADAVATVYACFDERH
jgi:hypothetical protein